MKTKLFCFFLSFLIVAFGHPAWLPVSGSVAAAIGFALFWKTLFDISGFRKQFFLSLFWFASIQAVQLSWLASTDYMGPLIYIVYGFLCLGIGAQFGFLSLLLMYLRKQSFWVAAVAVSGSWVLLEWLRTFFFTGFTWNPIGFALSGFDASIQMASLFGIYGLSFWMILTNLAALQAWQQKENRKYAAAWLCLAAFPYLFGVVRLQGAPSRDDFLNGHSQMAVALMQPALLPEQRDFIEDRSEAYIPPLDQWERMIQFLDPEKKIDLIVFPESAFPYGARKMVYPLELVKALWQNNFGAASFIDFPPFTSLFASNVIAGGSLHWKVNNAFLAQALSNHFKADVIIGLDDQDFANEGKYNAAFHFVPGGKSFQRYEKRTLVPISEYIPFQGWGMISRFIANQFGIYDSFQPGRKVKIFSSFLPIGVSICIEETYGSLMRDLRLQGAQVFVNVTNDVWFPRSRLPKVHYEHARMRAVENGVCSLRACNTGITGAIDNFGKAMGQLVSSESDPGIFYFSAPLNNQVTVYTFWGEWGILGISLASLLFGLAFKKKKLP